jgi:type II secretory pathway pseudopilin PulG
MGFGFLALAPLLALGLSGARQARENRATAQIAATLIEQAKQGTPAAGTLYFDSAGNPVTAGQATYTVQESITSCAGNSANGGPLNRLTLQVAPTDSADGARTYADVYATSSAP